MKNSKKLIVILSALLLFVFALPLVDVLADDNIALSYIDYRDDYEKENDTLLTESQAKELNTYLCSISEKCGYQIAVAIVSTVQGYDPEYYAEIKYREASYNNDGIILLIATQSRDWALMPMGVANKATGRADNYAHLMIEDAFYDDLHYGNYFSSFKKYGEACERVFTYYKDNGKPLKEPFNAFKWAAIGIAVGLVIALIVTSSMKRQLKSVAMQQAAQNYIKAGSLNLTQSRDYFVYRTVTKTAIPKSSGSSRSGGHGGRSSSRGGSHGKF